MLTRNDTKRYQQDANAADRRSTVQERADPQPGRSSWRRAHLHDRCDRSVLANLERVAPAEFWRKSARDDIALWGRSREVITMSALPPRADMCGARSKNPSLRCLIYPRQRTLNASLLMSAKYQEPTSRVADPHRISALLLIHAMGTYLIRISGPKRQKTTKESLPKPRGYPSLCDALRPQAL